MHVNRTALRSQAGISFSRLVVFVFLILQLAVAPPFAGGTPHSAGQGRIPEQSIVKVFLQHASEGVMLRDQYIPQPTVFEVSEFMGIVFSEAGHVVSYLGDYWPTADQFQHTQAKVQTLDGKGYAARILGMDKRLSLLVLRSDVPSDWAVRASASPESDHLTIVTLADETLMVGSPCVRSRKSQGWLPSTDLKVSGLDLQACSWTGSLAMDLEGDFVGIVSRVEPHPFSRKLADFQLLTSRIIGASVERIESTGQNVSAGWLGVNLVQEGNRILVTQVVPASPAERAGLQPADVIEQLEGHDVSFAELLTAIRWRGPGAETILGVRRNGELKRLPVVLGERQIQPKLAWAIQVPDQLMEDRQLQTAVRFYKTVLPPIVDLGFVVERLSEQLARKLQSPQPGGLLVTSIRGGSPAEQAGFQAGDVLFVVNGHAIFSVSDVQESLRRSQDKFIEIRFVRDGKIQQKRISPP